MSSAMQPRDRMIPWYFVIFFLFIALVDGIMVTIAVNTHSGMVTDHPYERGLKYNEVVKAEEAQALLGWKGAIDFQDKKLEFRLRDKDDRPIAPDSTIAYFTRPTQEGMDFTVEIREDKTQIQFPAKGLWEVRVEAIYQGHGYQQSKRIVVR